MNRRSFLGGVAAVAAAAPACSIAAVGRFSLPTKPGLGFELSEASLSTYPFGGSKPMARVFH
jgi:L-alanine-DL-glutamate epimerase-like enolase superfamily enzyme